MSVWRRQLINNKRLIRRRWLSPVTERSNERLCELLPWRLANIHRPCTDVSVTCLYCLHRVSPKKKWDTPGTQYIAWIFCALFKTVIRICILRYNSINIMHWRLFYICNFLGEQDIVKLNYSHRPWDGTNLWAYAKTDLHTIYHRSWAFYVGLQ